jgi:branched-subunit amino acid ABC-type transport system permease component
MDMEIIMALFAIVILGGVGSLGGALVGSLLIGLLESFGILVLPKFAIALAYGLLVVVLIVRPQGFMGKIARWG